MRALRSGRIGIVLAQTLSLAVALRCYCEGHCPDGRANGSCEARLGAQCFSFAEQIWDDKTGQYAMEWSFGCMPPGEMGLLQCNANLHVSRSPLFKKITCCNETDLCNNDAAHMETLSTLLVPKTTTPSAPERPGDLRSNPVFVVLFFGSIALLIGIFVSLMLRLLQRQGRGGSRSGKSELESELSTQGTLVEVTSGSGRGQKVLAKATIGRQLEMLRVLAVGGFSEVWLALWCGEKVVAKVSSTPDEASWQREAHIYESLIGPHDNILRYIAADMRSNGCSSPQLLVVTDYHSRGSLHEYLQTAVLDYKAMRTICLSFMSGLEYLHADISAAHGKPGIAHRDLKSKNVLVKDNGECAIADFGLAAWSYNSGTVDATDTRVGTRRLLAYSCGQLIPF